MRILVLGDRHLTAAIARGGYQVTNDPGDKITCTVSDISLFRAAPKEMPQIILSSNTISDWAAKQECPDAVFRNSIEEVLNTLSEMNQEECPCDISGRRSLLILTHSNKGGVGKTSAAISMGVTLSNMGIKTVICDFDFGGPDVGSFFNIKKEAKTYISPVSRESVMSCLYKASDNLFILPWNEVPEMPGIKEEDLIKTISILQETFQAVIGDTMPAPWEKSYIYPLFERADLVYSIVDPSKFSLNETQKYAPSLLLMGVKPENIRIVVNRYNPKLASIKEMERVFCSGFKKNIKNLPRVAAVIPESFEDTEKAVKKSQINNQEEWEKPCREIVRMLNKDIKQAQHQNKKSIFHWRGKT